jgi:hypothetical protein
MPTTVERFRPTSTRLSTGFPANRNDLLGYGYVLLELGLATRRRPDPCPIGFEQATQRR